MTHTNIAKSATYIANYDVGLVVLSIVVASVASYTALNLAGRVTVAQGISRNLWLIGGAIAMGIGIWSMHFVAMLAYQLPIPMTYNIPTVLLSMVAAVLASGLALFLVSGQRLNWLQFLLGIIFMGLGIASMHYIGMVAMRLEASAQYNPNLVGLSFAIAIGVSGVALWLAFLLRAEVSLVGNVRKLGSAIVMGHAVAGMHYTGMAAVSFQPLPINIHFDVEAQPSQTMDNSLLAFGIGIATLLILGLAVLASLFDQRLSTENARAETLRQSEERFRSLVQNLSSVIAVIAADLTISYTSSSVQQILGYEPKEWFGTKVLKYVHPEDLVKAENFLTAALNGSATHITGEFRLRHVDNSWREFEVIANNLLSEPSVRGIVTTYRDITERKQAESALRQAEVKYRSIFENTAEGIFQTTVDGHYISANPALAQIYGYAFAEELITSLSNLDQQLYVEASRRVEFIRLMQRHGMVSEFESQVYCKDGSVIWISENARTIRDASGQVLGYEGTVRDITAGKRAEEIQIRKSRQAALRASVSEAFATSDTADLPGVLQRCCESMFHHFNAVFAQIWTLNEEENVLELQAGCRIYTPIDGCHSRVPVGEFEVGIIAQERQPYLSNDVQNDSLISDKEWAKQEGMVAFAGYPLIVEQRVVGVMAMFARELFIEDTLEALVSVADTIAQGIARKQAEAAVRQSEEKYRSVVDNVKEVIFQMDAAGAWTFLNRAWTEITGFSIDESIGKKFLSYVCPDDQQQALNLLQSLIERYKDHCQDEIRCLTKDGDCRVLEVYARRNLNAAGNVIGISGTLNDITERQQVDRMKKEFVSTVSHELRTPLTSILGSLGLVANGVAGEIPASAKAMIDIAYKNSERLVRLINDILDIEKIESGKMAFNLQPLELIPLVEQAIASNQAYGEQFQVKFILENTLVGVRVNADSDRLIQVLTNLLSNAAKFSPPDSTVIISVARHNQAIRIAIADRGPGIPKDFRNRIFQKFAQADSSDTRQKGGTGLGLSITKAIVEKHGGQIGFTTETNVGTTFYFDLPEWYEPTITVFDHNSLPPQVLPILICEDDSDIANLLKLLLEPAGFKTDIAYNAAQAKQMLTQNQYAAMTLDIALPDVDGLSLLRELRQQDITRQLPIVVVSAKAELARREINGNAIAVIDWLNKPIDQTRLIAAVKQATQQIGSKPRILHVEDNPDVRQVVGAIVQNVAEICWAVNLQAAQQKLAQENFDLIILDLSLPDGCGLDLLQQLNDQSRRPTPVVVFSAQEVARETVQDAAAVLIKSRTSNQKLLETIQTLTTKFNDTPTFNSHSYSRR